VAVVVVEEEEQQKEQQEEEEEGEGCMHFRGKWARSSFWMKA